MTQNRQESRNQKVDFGRRLLISFFPGLILIAGLLFLALYLTGNLLPAKEPVIASVPNEWLLLVLYWGVYFPLLGPLVQRIICWTFFE